MDVDLVAIVELSEECEELLKLLLVLDLAIHHLYLVHHHVLLIEDV